MTIILFVLFFVSNACKSKHTYNGLITGYSLYSNKYDACINYDFIGNNEQLNIDLSIQCKFHGLITYNDVHINLEYIKSNDIYTCSVPIKGNFIGNDNFITNYIKNYYPINSTMEICVESQCKIKEKNIFETFSIYDDDFDVQQPTNLKLRGPLEMQTKKTYIATIKNYTLTNKSCSSCLQYKFYKSEARENSKLRIKCKFESIIECSAISIGVTYTDKKNIVQFVVCDTNILGNTNSSLAILEKIYPIESTLNIKINKNKCIIDTDNIELV